MASDNNNNKRPVLRMVQQAKVMQGILDDLKITATEIGHALGQEIAKASSKGSEYIVVHGNGQGYPHHEHTIRKFHILRWTASQTEGGSRLFFRDGTNMTVEESYQHVTDCMLA